MEKSNVEAVVPEVHITASIVEMSSKIGNIAAALAKSQSKLEAVKKGEEGYGYNYASLASTIETSSPILTSNNLAVTQLVGNTSNGNPSVTTILMHGETGEYIMGTASIPRVEMKGCNVAQESGATLSYLRRYALQALLNMASEDNDASSNGNKKPANKTSFNKKTVNKDDSSKEEKKGGRQAFRKKKVTTDEDDI